MTTDVAEASVGTGPSDGRTSLMIGAVALLLAGIGVVVIQGGGGAGSVGAAMLLWTGALAAAGVALGRGPGRGEDVAPRRDREGGETAGSDREEPEPPVQLRRRLSVSERLALGAVGGLLGGILVAAAVWITTESGLARLLGSSVSGAGGWFGLAVRIGNGAAWGLVFGVLYRWLPGRSAVSRAMVFAALAALYALLVEFPLLRDAGWFAVDLGATTFLFVVFYHFLWGVSLASVFQWAEITSEGALDRPLVP